MNKSSQEIATVNTSTEYGKRKKISGTRSITYQATLVAMALALKLVGQVFQFGSYKFTFVYFPWIVAAIVMGPLRGAAVVCITDIIGTLILQTGGLPLPLIVLSNTLFGFFMGCAFKIPKLDDRLKLFIGLAVVIAVCTLGISTAALADVQGLPFKVVFISRLTLQVPVIAVNALLVGFSFPILRKLKLM